VPTQLDPINDPDQPLAVPADVSADFSVPDAKSPAHKHLRDSIEAQEVYDRAVREAGTGNQGRAVEHFLRAAKLAEAAHEWYLAAIALRTVGDIFHTPEPPYDLQRALRMYRRAIAAFEACGHFDEARDLAYHVSKLRLWQGGELGLSAARRAELFVFWLVAGFGLRPLRVLGTAVWAIVGFALYFWAVGGVATQTGEPVGGFVSALYFSGVTFSTVGYGDFVPTPHTRLVAMCEALVGAFTIGLFVVVLANRVRR
jgi:hypothetical protein